MLKGYMNPQPAPTHEGSTIENITRYIKDTEKEGQLAGRTIAVFESLIHRIYQLHSLQ